MAVSSADLATNIGNASAALAVGNNTYEETLALMTGIVEITRNGSKASRALVSVQSRLNQVVDESSSTGKALTEWYEQHNIALYDQEGQLRSLYDVLSDVSDIWPELTTNEKDYYLNQQAGANQTQNLAAALNNFEGVEQAYTLALNSAGSAMKENEAYAESLEFKQNQLNASFQEMANNLVSGGLVGGILDFANGLIQLDNAMGNVISRVLILTGLGWGGTQLLSISKLIPVVVSQFKNFAAAVSLAAAGTTSFGGAVAAAGGFASVSLPIILAMSAAIAVVVAGIKGWQQLQEATFPTADEFNQKLKETNDQLEANKQRLDEINAMPWNERTQEILNEKAALEAENEELGKNLELTEKKAVSAAKTALFGSEGSAAYVSGGTALGGFRPAGDAKADETTSRNIEQAKEYISILEREGQLTDEQNVKTQELLSTMAERAQYYEILRDNADSLTDEQQEQLGLLEQEYNAYQQLVSAYDQAVYGGEALVNAYTELSNAGYIAEETYQRLIGIYPQLADGAVQTANGYQIEQSALENLMSAEQRQQAEINALVNGFIEEARQSGATEQALLNLVQAQITASNTGLNFTQQIAALQALAQQAGYTAAYVQNVLSAGLSQSNIERTARGLVEVAARKGQKLSYQDALARATKQANQELERRWKNLTSSAPSGGYTPSFTGGSGVSAPSSSGTSGKTSSTYDDSKRSEAQAEIKRLQSQQDAIQDQIDAVNEKYDAQLEELEDINDALEEQIQLQKLLQALTEAKASKKMVFKDGRFQYLSDVDAISKAQSNLEEFYQEQELKKKKKRIEEERQAELAGLNAEKKNLQDRISAWRDYISEMSGQYSSSLSGLQGYVDSWNSKIGQIKQTPDYTGGGGNNDKPKDDKPATEDLTKYKPSSPTDVWVKRVQAYLGWNTDGYGDDSDATKLKKKGGTWQTAYNKAKAAYDHGKKKFEDRDTTYITSIRGYKRSGYSEDIAYILAAKNIDKYAKGALSAQSGLSMVGEQGPELRVLNQGDGIIPAKQTATLWSFANDPAKFLQNLNNIGGKTEVINVANVSLPNVQNPQEFISGLRNLAYQRTYKPNFGTV